MTDGDENLTPGPSRAQTSMHVRRAIDGDDTSLGWVMEHLTPLLVAQAEYRLGPVLRREVDAEDLVNGAWVIALPRLNDLVERGGRTTPVLLRFLSTSIILQVKKLLRRRSVRVQNLFFDEDEDPLTRLADETRGVPTRVKQNELRKSVRDAIDDLPETYREAIILRGIEQHPAKDAALLLGISSAAVDQRYSRALKRLRERMPSSVFDELDEV